VRSIPRIIKACGGTNYEKFGKIGVGGNGKFCRSHVYNVGSKYQFCESICTNKKS